MLRTWCCKRCHYEVRSANPPEDRCPECESAFWEEVAPRKAKVSTEVLDLEPAPPPPPQPFYPEPVRTGGRHSLVAFGITYWGNFACYLLWMSMMFMAPFFFDSPGAYLLSWFVLFFLTLGLGITATVLGLMKLYAGWQAVQPLRQMDYGETNMPTPGKAVGFLFIPFFNLYWMFVAMPGLANRVNIVAAHRGMGRLMTPGIASAPCILFLLSFLIIPVPVAAVLYFIFMVELNNALNILEGHTAPSGSPY